LRLQNEREGLYWKVLIDLADEAKRQSKFDMAKQILRMAAYLQPYAYQGWLEAAKIEEESGNVDSCAKLLIAGLKFNPSNEILLIKNIKILEKQGKFK